MPEPSLEESSDERLIAVYQRVSSDRQDLARQAAQLERAKAENHGREIRVIEDDGVSAYTVSIFDRPGGRELCRLIENDQVEKVYTDAQDRLSRGDDLEWITFRTLLTSHKTTLIIDGTELRDDFGGRIEGYLKALLARQESAEKGHRIASGKATKAKAGKWHHGDASPGYRFDKETGELEATDDLPLIREAGERFLARETYKQISNFLSATLSEEALIRRKNSRAYVSRDRLRGWLSNPVYTGYIVRHRGLDTEELHQGSHTPAWSIEKFEAIQRLLAEKREKNASRQPRAWALSGIAKCPACGHAQRLHPVSNHGRTYVYIRCAGEGCPERSRLQIAAAYEANVLSGLAAIAYAIDDLLATDPQWGEPTKSTEENPDDIRAARDTAQAELDAIQKELILSPSLRDDPEIQKKRQQVLRQRDGHAAHLDRLINHAKSHREQLRTLADSILSLSALSKPDPWIGYIAEETITLIDEKHGREGPDERTSTINHEGHTRPTMLQLLEGWRLANLDQRCAAIRPALEAVYAGRETVEYRFHGLASPISINAAFDSKRGAPLKALEESGFGLTHVGNNRRAVNLHRAARRIASAGWPEDLTELPGVGRYTADAVARFALGAPLLPVDTNVRRVQERTGARFGPASAQPLMDLGATVCLARVPRCRVCPLAGGCPSRGRRYPPLRKQSRFEGSFRQRRGHTLRLVTERPRRLTDLDRQAVTALVRDGLVQVEGEIAALPAG